MLIAGGVGLQGGQNVVADNLAALWAGDSVLHEDLALLVGVGHVNQVIHSNGLRDDGVSLDSHRVHNGVVFPIGVDTALVLHHVDVHLHGDGLAWGRCRPFFPRGCRATGPTSQSHQRDEYLIKNFKNMKR